MERIVGIDLGTTNSLVAVWEGGAARVIPDERGRGLLPSVVRYEAGADGGVRTVVGVEARDRAAEFPGTTVSSVKRLMGRSREDAAADLPYLSYRVVEGERRTARVLLPMRHGGTEARRHGGGEEGGKELVVTPQEVSAVILRELKERASRALGLDTGGTPVPLKAVVTVPAYFDDAQRQATRDAGRLAGLDVVRIVNEPTAAALAYGLGVREALLRGEDAASSGTRDSARVAAKTPRTRGTDSEGPKVVAVYDLGGGTFDVSILKLTPAGEGGTEFFQVVSTAGDTHLGGDDVDRMLVEVFLRELHHGRAEDGTPVAPGDLQRLRMAAERVKCELSERESAEVEVAVEGAAGGVFRRTVTRAELEALVAPWVVRTIAACERAVRDARRELGGALLRREDAASSGTRIGSESRPTRGIDAVVLVGGATRMPVVRRRVREYFGIEPYTALDPDTVVALGAAVQGAVLSGEVTGTLLLDVIPLSLGIETVGGAVAKLIMRNSGVPARATEMFSTSVDGQTSIKLHVLQGEREMAADCRSLGEFHLRGLPPMPAGIPQLEVEFLVDANGVLNVSAHERRSGRRSALQVVPNHGLTREEVDRMEAESFAHAREDMTRHRVVDLIVNAKLDVKWISERLERYRVNLEAGYAEALKSQISNLKAQTEQAEADWRSVDANAFQRAKEELDRASVRLQEVGIAESLRDERVG
ncbi:MAG: Hsp70 family protein [Phycisphaerales bacterium]